MAVVDVDVLVGARVVLVDVLVLLVDVDEVGGSVVEVEVEVLVEVDVLVDDVEVLVDDVEVLVDDVEVLVDDVEVLVEVDVLVELVDVEVDSVPAVRSRTQYQPNVEAGLFARAAKSGGIRGFVVNAHGCPAGAVQNFGPSSFAGACSIHTVNADGTGQARLSTGSVADPVNPTWSPDGTTIAFSGRVAGDGDQWFVYTMALDGSEPSIETP